jgi:hypothetical protein
MSDYAASRLHGSALAVVEVRIIAIEKARLFRAARVLVEVDGARSWVRAGDVMRLDVKATIS